MQGSAHFSTFPGRQIWQGGVIQLFVVLSGNARLDLRPRRPLFAVFDGWDLRWWAGEGKAYPILGPGPFFQLQCDDAMIWFSQNTFIVDEDLWRSLLDRFRQCKTHFKTMSYLLRIMWSTISKPFQAYFALFNLKKKQVWFKTTTLRYEHGLLENQRIYSQPCLMRPEGTLQGLNYDIIWVYAQKNAHNL